MKTAFLQIPISSQVKETLVEKAGLLGMSACEYVRTLILEDIRKLNQGS